jgi:hypothetical protein
MVKTVKTGEERHIPIHPELVRLGFLVYLDRIKGQGAKRLFPGFGMNKGDAAARAKSWFSDYLEELGLRDETPKALISGLYAFRKTFITAAHILGLKFEPITGHADKDRSKVTLDSYIFEEIPLRCFSVARLRTMARHVGGDGLDAFEIDHTGFERRAAVANATAAGYMCGGLPRHKPDADRRRTGSQRGEGVWHLCATARLAGCLRKGSQIRPPAAS